MDTPELIFMITITAVALGVLVGVLTSRIAVDRFLRSEKDYLAQGQLEVAGHRAEQVIVDKILKDRERDVTEREQGLRRSAKEAAANLHAESEHWDTKISVLDIDDLPHPNDVADTIAIPAVEEK